MKNISSKKPKPFLLVFTVFILLAGAIVLLSTRHATGFPLPSMSDQIIENARMQQYRPIIGDLRANEIPWIFDGKYIARGVVIDAWSGDTEQNIKACKEEWSKASVYSVMCKQIKDVEIIAVKIADIGTKDILFIPVERFAKLRNGDEVVVRLGEINADGLVMKLPSLLNVLKWKHSPLTDAQD